MYMCICIYILNGCYIYNIKYKISKIGTVGFRK